MNTAVYSSLAAYLAYWHALHRKAESAREAKTLAQMNRTIEEILGADAKYLIDEPADSAARRRRDRAELKLRRELAARGVIAG